MAYHDSFGRPCGSTGVNKGTAIAWLLLVGSVLKFVLFFFGIVFGHANFD
jgi:hypothetical protein